MAETTGALTEAVYYILLALYEPMHGYGIMQRVQALSSGRVTLGAGTLYGALSTLLEKGWITPTGSGVGDRRKEYAITPQGKTAAEAEIRRLEELIRNGRSITGGAIQ
ncbi:MAG: PadR family transcriptional regulator [Bacillota bacterium]